MINVNGITKNFGDVVAVNNISFSINKGEITGLLGPNGAGKTTTMRMLTCYLEPDAGEISVGNYKVNESPIEVKSLLGYLPESAPIYGEMLVYDYLKYISEIRGIEDNGRIKEMGALCGLNDVMHKSVNELSKGYKQRVGLAHAMIHDPEILILDEPTSGLDPNQIIEIRNLIKKIGKEKTIILSTHILPEVEATCDRVIIIDKGNIIADDRTNNLHSYSKEGSNIFIKVKGPGLQEFSSSMNNIGGVTDVSENPGPEDLLSVVISASSDHDLRPEVYKTIKEKDWVLYEMRQEQRSLENIFRELTTGGENE